MKRIWGRVKYENFPNSVTLNALAAYLGYSNWRDFCDRHPIAESNPVSDPSEEIAAISDKRRTNESRLKIFSSGNLLLKGIALVIILTVAGIAIIGYAKREKNNS